MSDLIRWLLNLFFIFMFFFLLNNSFDKSKKAYFALWILNLRESSFKLNNFTHVVLTAFKYLSGEKLFCVKSIVFSLTFTTFIMVLIILLNKEDTGTSNFIFSFPFSVGAIFSWSIYLLPLLLFSLWLAKLFLRVRKIYFYIFLFFINIIISFGVILSLSYFSSTIIASDIDQFREDVNNNSEFPEPLREAMLNFSENFKSELDKDEEQKKILESLGVYHAFDAMKLSPYLISLPAILFALIISLSPIFFYIISIIILIGNVLFNYIPRLVFRFDFETKPFAFLGLIFTSLYSLIYWL